MCRKWGEVVQRFQVLSRPQLDSFEPKFKDQFYWFPTMCFSFSKISFFPGGDISYGPFWVEKVRWANNNEMIVELARLVWSDQYCRNR